MTTDEAVRIVLDEIGCLKQDVEKLRVQNEVFRSILLGIYRCNGIHDAESGRRFDDHVRRIYDHLSCLAETHPFLKTLAAEVHEFLVKDPPPPRTKFEVIQGGLGTQG